MTILDNSAEKQTAAEKQAALFPPQGDGAEPTAAKHTATGLADGNKKPPPVSNSFLDKFFQISKRGSTLAREFRGGLVTFFTMAYIVILNPLILGGFSAENAPTDVAGGWLSAAQVGAVTGLTAGVMTIIFGLVANLPSASQPAWASTRSSPSRSSRKSHGQKPWAWWSSTAS